jgi:hypothetical protein
MRKIGAVLLVICFVVLAGCGYSTNSKEVVDKQVKSWTGGEIAFSVRNSDEEDYYFVCKNKQLIFIKVWPGKTQDGKVVFSDKIRAMFSLDPSKIVCSE